ncbi:MAG TPA: glycosyltransferase [Flavobacterium sp.]|jgi:glycosyltransferase involved in cell wall biosynthesis
MYFSIIIPVYNRPDEINELLDSLSRSTYQDDFEVVIVEDGSNLPSSDVIAKYQAKLNITYFAKPNSGPGDSRNFGMRKAAGDYFIIFDSDCIIPEQYLCTVSDYLISGYCDCFGGPDKALPAFSDVQKAISFAMTSFLTTGGIRGGSEVAGKFQPRSFNMGLSRAAFESSGGFGNIHPGEDPDLSLRLWKLGFKTLLFPNAYVYHKRRIDWEKFFVQVNKFGKARPILNKWHPGSGKVTFFFPTAFLLGSVIAMVLLLIGVWQPIACYGIYFSAAFMLASIEYKSIKIGLFALIAVAVQFYGYGLGFLKSFFYISILNRDPKVVFPELFFKS